MLNGLSAMIEIIVILICVNYMYSKKIKLNIYDVLFVGLQMTIVESVNYFAINKKIILVCYLLIFLFQLLKFKLSTEEICVNTMLLVCISVVTQLISSVPMIVLNPYVSTDVLVLGNNVIALILVYVLGKTKKLYKIRLLTMNYEWFSKVCMLCCFVGCIYIIIVYKMEEYLRPTDYLIFGVWTFLMFLMALNWQKNKALYQVKKKELEITNVYDQYTEELLQTVIKKQHDFDNYLQALLAQFEIATTLDELVYDQKKFIFEINQDNHFNKLLAGGKSLIVVFLYSKFVNAENKGCQINYIVKTNEMLCNVPLYNLVEIIGILFDNAVEAVARGDDRRICVRIIETEKEIEIMISNPSLYVTQEELQNWLQTGTSTKGENRGLGLANVMEIVERYDADFFLYNEEVDQRNFLVAKFVTKKDL